jgi:carboxypeptidase C (cathepsin A)
MKTMRRGAVLCAVLLCAVVLVLQFPSPSRAQDKDAKDAKAPDAAPAATPAPKEESSVTEHTVRIAGVNVPYKATAATILLKNDKDEPTALVYFTAYTRSDVKDLSQRPIAFLYNGGPGSSSLWVHMGSFGPRRAVVADAEASPAGPYKMNDNQYSLLDKSDLVFIDPVGTGFSHAVGKAADKDFWGVDEDVKSLAQFINAYVSRNDRWNSPKFLIGESYGTFRSAALSNYLQNNDGMYFNGLVLISSVLDLGTISFNPSEDMPYVFYLPSYAATAWYHNMLKDRPADMKAFAEEARTFALTDYANALNKGSRLTAAEKADMAKKLSHYTGLSEDYLLKADLRVALPQFMKELQRSRGLTTGRLDARFSGFSYDLLGEFAEFDPQDTAITGPFVAVWNNYVRTELKFGQDKTYHPSSGEANQKWDWKHNAGDNFGFPGSPNVEGDLIQALLTNPHLKVEIENGYYDLATPFFATEFTVDHLGLPEKLQKNIALQYYDAGHMMYVHEEDLAKLKTNVANFIDAAAKP